MTFSTWFSARVIRRVTALGASVLTSALLCGWFPAAAQTVDLATSPLYAGGAAVPNVAIVASFEFPTFGQAYLGLSYNAASVYTGYFNPTKCYSYNGDPLTEDPNGYFYISSAAINHVCLLSFSGNYLNFATITAADEFRYALTGGNRVLESGPNSGTILQRAYLTGCNANVSNCSSFTNFSNQQIRGVPDFYANSSTFPTQLAPAGTLGGLTVGGVVTALLGGYVNNCKTFMYITAFPSGGNCFAPNKELGIYNVRVNVCDAAEGPTRTDLCLYYPAGGKYKPVGVVQKNANAMRFSIFGYVIDRSVGSYVVPSACSDSANSYPTGIWNRCRVGGVLRAPMKFVGPNTYDASGAASVNAKAEINADGTFVNDPEGTAAAWGGQYSGFVNYLNRFGSATQALPQTGTGGAGEYKRYDTLGEMYYEAIRYYQNLAPTPETYQPQNGVPFPNQVAGYFPIVTNWADPIIAACSNNYIVAIADAYTWDDVYIPGYNGSPPVPPQNNLAYYRASSRAPEGGLDAYAWTQKIGVLEATTPASGTSGNDVHPQMNFYSNSRHPSTGIQDALIGSLNTGAYFDAGAAYWANTNDIRSDLAGTQTIKTIAVDVGSGGTSNLWDRQLYLMGKYGGFTVPTTTRSDGSQLNPFYATNPTNPTGPGVRSNSEWESSAGSGYPANYLFAKDPQALINGLQAAFSNIAAQSGTAAGSAVTSASLNNGAAGTYIAQFSPTRWSGTVINETVSQVGGVLTVNATPVWDAGKLLTTRCGTTAPYSTLCTDASLTATGNRNIVTTITSAGVRSGTNFALTNLAADVNYSGALNISPVTGVVDGLAQQRINYLRGYRGDEASLLAFRTRDAVFGDVINSAPVYVGAPSTSITDTSYQSFYTANVGRTAAVYVGANDGMLHALNASTGAELFAYIPGFVSSYLSDLTNPGYTHEPFVDAIPVIQEAKVNGSFKTVLVSGTGSGGSGVFALDVTDPTVFGPSKVIFEFTDADDYDLGNVVTAPLIVKLQNGTSTSGGVTTPTYGYFAAVTSYDSRRPLCKSPGNTNLLSILAGAPSSFFSSIPNCTSNSQGDTYLIQDSANRGVLYLLSLDRTIGTPWVQGSNYYKFYFPAINTTTRNGLGPVAALPSGTGDGSAGALYFGDLQGQLWRLNTLGAPSTWTPSRGTVAAPLPVFVATSSTNAVQPITARPELGTGPYGSTLVVFGTGAYLGQSDISAAYTQQSEYALIDDNGSMLISRSNLQQRTATVSGTQVTVTGNPFTYSGASSAIKGWYIDFPSTSTGERMVNKAAYAPGLLSFTSLTLANSVCGSGGGYVYQVNPITGLPLVTGNVGGYVSTVGIPGPPVIVNLTVTPGQARATGEQINQITQTTLVSGTSGNIKGIGTPGAAKAPPVGRVSWREITNYNDQPKTP